MRSRKDAMRWMNEGTALFAKALAAEDDDRLAEGSGLDGWTAKHLVAHLALNAAALGNLVTWARTGVETPMYPSMEVRNADIETNSARRVSDLRQWFTDSAAKLTADLEALTDEQWRATIRTRAGREITAEEIPWMRTREVMVHATDLGEAVRFTDLPEDFLAALVDDIVAARSADPKHPALVVMSQFTGEAWAIEGVGEPVRVMGSLPDLAAWLTGRSGTKVKAIGAAQVPDIPAWL